MLSFKKIMLCAALLSLNGCTFRPLYGTYDNEASEHLASINDAEWAFAKNHPPRTAQ
jgi:hypothetical protein